MFIQAKEKKKTGAIRGMPVEREDVTALICLMFGIVVLTKIRYTRAHCTVADLAAVAGGSFLLAIVCHVNGCKNIIRPVSSDRLPPLVPAATGEGMGVHINLQRNL